MIIKFFHQGQNQADYIINYLLSEDKHNGIKPEVLQGNPELSRTIINSITKYKNKYTTGVISFKEGETLTLAQQHELIEHFEKAFCPFDDPARVNFLWVKHIDKGRLEMHFLSARQDLKSGLSFNMAPPGKANQLFYESFTRLQNLKYGFEQIDKKQMTAQDARFYKDTFTDLFEKRKNYLYNHYDKPKTIKTKGAKNGRKRISGIKGSSYRPNVQYAQFRNIASSFNFKAQPSRSLQQSIRAKPNRNEGNLHRHGSATQSVESFAEYARNATQAVARFSNGFGFSGDQKPSSRPNAGTPKQGMSIEAEILALAVELNHCEPWEAASIEARLNYLQGVKSRQGYVDPLATTGKRKLKPS